jgi:hypothetical protein
MILSRHVEILRADNGATCSLVALFGGSAANPLNIKCCPFAEAFEVASVPALFCTLPSFDRKPGPGHNTEVVVVRDVIRFHSEAVSSEEALWTPGLHTVVSHLIGVVQSNQQLTYDTSTNGADNGIVQLATRADIPEINVEQKTSPQNGEGLNLWDLNIDFPYLVQVNAKTIPPRLWPLVTVGA